MDLFEIWEPSRVTKLFIVISVILTILTHLNVIDPTELYFNPEIIFKKHEYWRLFTSIFYCGPISISTILDILNIGRSCSYIEVRHFGAAPLDFILLSLFGIATFWFIGISNDELFFGSYFAEFFTYYFSKIAPNVQFLINLIPLKNKYIPLFYLFSDIFSRSLKSLKIHLVVFFSAHMYFFIREVICLRYDVRLLHLPDWMNQKFQQLF